MYALLGHGAQFIGGNRYIEHGERLGTFEFAVFAHFGDKSRDFCLDALRHNFTGVTVRVGEKRFCSLCIIDDASGYSITETVDNLLFVGSAILTVNQFINRTVVG